MLLRNELAEALKRLGPQFAVAGLFSGAINLLYLSSPLYLMQIYNRVLESENVTTLILLTVVLGLALITMGALDATRSQLLIRSGIRLDTEIAPRVFRALVEKSAYQGYSRGSQQMRQLDQFRTFVTGPGIFFAFDIPWIPLYLLLLFFIHPLLGAIASLGAIGLFGLALFNERLTRPSLKSAENAANGSYGFTENILRHADVVLSMGMQPAIERHWSTNRDKMLVAQAYASDRNAIIASGIRFARLLLQSLMLGQVPGSSSMAPFSQPPSLPPVSSWAALWFLSNKGSQHGNNSRRRDLAIVKCGAFSRKRQKAISTPSCRNPATA